MARRLSDLTTDSSGIFDRISTTESAHLKRVNQPLAAHSSSLKPKVPRSKTGGTTRPSSQEDSDGNQPPKHSQRADQSHTRTRRAEENSENTSNSHGQDHQHRSRAGGAGSRPAVPATRLKKRPRPDRTCSDRGGTRRIAIG